MCGVPRACPGHLETSTGSFKRAIARSFRPFCRCARRLTAPLRSALLPAMRSRARRGILLSAFLAIALSACNGTTAPLIDGGGDGGCLDDGGCNIPDAGDGGTDGGGSCWRGLADAGVCTMDLECSGGDYCNFTISFCANVDFIASVVPGSCLPTCNPPDGLCQSGEDCPQDQLCIGTSLDDICTVEHLCDSGYCGHIPCPDSNCPSDCTAIVVPHNCTFCKCPADACDAG